MKKLFTICLMLISIIFIAGCENTGSGNTNEDGDYIKYSCEEKVLELLNQDSISYNYQYLSFKVTRSRNNVSSLLKIEPNMDSVKYLVGYYAKSDEIDNTEYTWYEFNKIEDAPEKIGNLKKGIKTYMVFDGKIRNDYLNSSELDINVNIKYFYNNEKGDITITEEMLLWGPTLDELQQAKEKSGTDYCPIIASPFNNYYELYDIDVIDGVEYFKEIVGVFEKSTDQYNDRTTSEHVDMEEEFNSIVTIDENNSIEYENRIVYYGLYNINKIIELIEKVQN